MPKAYVLDMFPYPSGAGLHVGHPEGYTATDIVSRYLRMTGFNVLHPMGWDAFGLPAEQYAIKNNAHPRETTETNIKNFRRQIQMLGLSYDWDREVDTTDPDYYKWTQWIFLQLFNSYFDPHRQKAMPIAHLINELENENFGRRRRMAAIAINPTQEGMEEIAGEVRVERLWRELTPEEQRDVIDGQRLAYTDEVPVNWCPGLGTVLANEEVIDGKSEVGGYPGREAPDAAMDAAHHRLCGSVGRGSGSARVAGVAEGDAAELDRAKRRGGGGFRDRPADCTLARIRNAGARVAEDRTTI